MSLACKPARAHRAIACKHACFCTQRVADLPEQFRATFTAAAEGRYSAEDVTAMSSKIALLVDLVRSFRVTGHRALVFSQTRKMLDMVQAVLVADGTRYIRLDGLIKSSTERCAAARVRYAAPAMDSCCVCVRHPLLPIARARAHRTAAWSYEWMDAVPKLWPSSTATWTLTCACSRQASGRWG